MWQTELPDLNLGTGSRVQLDSALYGSTVTEMIIFLLFYLQEMTWSTVI